MANITRIPIINDRGPNHKYVIRDSSNPNFFVHETTDGFALYEQLKGAMVLSKAQAVRFLETTQSTLELVKYSSLPEYSKLQKNN